MKALFSIFILKLIAITLCAGQTIEPSIANQYDRNWEIESGIYRVMKNGKVGIVRANGEIIIPCDFNQVWNLDDKGFFRVLKAGKAGIYNINGQVIIPPEYDQVWAFKDDLAKVLKNGKLGYFNLQGAHIVPCEYQQIWSFENKRARVLRQGKIGYIDTNGNEIIPCEYQQIWAFEDDRARILKNGKVGYIDSIGNEVIPPMYTHIWAFEDGKAKALLDGQMLWIDTKGHPLDIPVPENIIEENTSSSTVEKGKKEFVIENESGHKTKIRILGGNIVISEQENDTHIEIGANDDNWRRTVNRRFKGHYTGLEIGFNNYMSYDNSTNLPPDDAYMELNAGKSTSYAINAFQWSMGLNRRGNLGLVTGLGIEWNNYHLSGPNLLTKDEAGYLTYNISTRPLDKNKLVTTHLNIPLLLEFQIPTHHHRKAFYISAGAIGGMRINSYTRTIYDDSEEPHKQKRKGNYNIRQFRYGAMARMGYRAINLYSTYYFSSLFEASKGPELYPVSIGLSLYFDL